MTGEQPSDDIDHTGEPVSDYASKTVMLVASHDDVISVEGYGEMTVAKRTDTYFGPELTLVANDGTNYRLVAPGFALDLELWRAVTDDEDFVEGWNRVGEIAAKLAEVGDAPQCECGELLSTRREKRQAFIAGVCPH
jgi:hypothetical protein